MTSYTIALPLSINSLDLQSYGGCGDGILLSPFGGSTVQRALALPCHAFCGLVRVRSVPAWHVTRHWRRRGGAAAWYVCISPPSLAVAGPGPTSLLPIGRCHANQPTCGSFLLPCGNSLSLSQSVKVRIAEEATSLFTLHSFIHSLAHFNSIAPVRTQTSCDVMTGHWSDYVFRQFYSIKKHNALRALPYP